LVKKREKKKNTTNFASKVEIDNQKFKLSQIME